ncbi:MAG TPA: hypothetical protein PKA41_15395, partial [Verrucomicrobiota bacterium]|nr:hypothetical protein [Verrucomicrobiota bacterium]
MNTTGVVGSTATFNVGATGTERTYQWQVDTGSGFANISGATLSFYTTPVLTGAEDGNQYRCVASVACDSSTDTSAPATLTVQDVQYRSAVASGNWADAGSWEVNIDDGGWNPASVSPNNTNSSGITVLNGHNITVAASVMVDQAVVNAGGQITVNSGQTLVVTNGPGTDCSVSGTISSAGTLTNATGTLLFESGGLYQHNQNGGVIAISTWNDGSTCELTGIAGTDPVAIGLQQDFYNFTWNNAGQTGSRQMNGSLTQVRGTLRVQSTGSGELRLAATAVALNLSVGNISVEGGTMVGASGNNTHVINVATNISVSGGTYNVKSSGTAAGGSMTVNVGGDVAVTGSGTLTKTDNGVTPSIRFSGTSPQTFTSGGTFTSTNDWTINTGAIVDFGTSVVTGLGRFTVASGGGLITANADGITTSGASGSIQVTGTRTYNAGGNYTYNGSGPQNTGNGLTGANNLTIDNGNDVTLSANATVTGTATLTDGKLITGANTLTLGSAASLAGVSSSRYIVGNLAKTFGVANDQSFNFAVGDSSDYTPVQLSDLDVSGGGTVVASVAGSEHPDIASSGVDGSLSVNRYWTLEGGDIAVGNYDATFNWVSGDVDGGADFNEFVVAKLNGTWSQVSVADPTATSIKAVGLTSFSDFVVGEEQDLVAVKLG